jgi:Uma2 family endonuclease
MTTPRGWTSADLELLPDDGKRYEIIDGELYVSGLFDWYHQHVSGCLAVALDTWSQATQAGEAVMAPGIIFREGDEVAPDVVWVSRERLATALWEDGHLHEAPELIAEVLSPGIANERRDRVIKRDLYARRGVLEYWIVDWRQRQIAVYRREQLTLTLAHTLTTHDSLESPLLPGFAVPLADLFADLPAGAEAPALGRTHPNRPTT